jgi:hypothetical protein
MDKFNFVTGVADGSLTRAENISFQADNNP